MVYRIHFTAEDLMRTRIAESPPPLGETSQAIRGLRRPPPRWLALWRSQATRRLPSRARMVFDLVPARGYAPGFLTPKQPGGLEDHLELVRSTPRSVIRQEMIRVAKERPVPAWARRLDDDLELLRQLADTLGQLHATLIAPYWPQMTAQITADRMTRARDLVDHGVDRLLRNLLPPQIRWNPPILEIHSSLTGDLYLNGRGLLLIPSVFGFAAPTVDCDAEPQPCLTYPARYDEHTLLGVTQPPSDTAALQQVAALLGRTRATVLHAIAHHTGCTTSELATATGTSLSSASEHAAVLRAAGLITTTRRQRSVLHAPTPLGLSLLNRPKSGTRPNGAELYN